MKIAVNTRLLLPGKLSGIGWFTFEVFKRIAAGHPEHQFYYLFDRQFSSQFVLSDNVIPVVIGPQARHPILFYWWYEYSVPRALKKIGADIFISPDNFNTTNKTLPSVMVIHDLNFEHYPQHLPWLISWYYRKFTPRMANAANRIVTVSEFSKNDISHQYGIDKEKIDVVYNGANTLFRPVPPDTQNSFRDKYSQSLPFFLFVGMIHPRKNLAKQLAAFDLFRENAANPPHKFLIVGEKWIIDSELKNVLGSMKFRDDVVFSGRLGVDELSVATGSATAIMYVSLFEGFGIPILEGFYSETPVITSNVSSMPEVAGDAALCVNPNSPEDIAEAMTRLAQDMDLRNIFIEKGRKQREEFSWDRSADLMWKAIEKCF